jgi:hypothetical protein
MVAGMLLFATMYLFKPSAHRFKSLSKDVLAAQIGPDCSIMIDNEILYGDPGTWIVIDELWERSLWSDRDFRQSFSPADADAQDYFNSTIHRT